MQGMHHGSLKDDFLSARCRNLGMYVGGISPLRPVPYDAYVGSCKTLEPQDVL